MQHSEIPAPAGDPGPAGSPGVHAASPGSADGAATSLQTAPAVSDAGGGSFAGRGHPRRFTAAEDAIVRDAAAGRIGRAHAAKLLRTNYRTLALRIAALGEPVRHYKPGPKPSPLSDCPRGWFPIAHGGCGKWREYEGTPISIEAARAAVDAGMAAMAQKRVDGSFDLLFRVLGRAK